jgi:hypothetical protein
MSKNLAMELMEQEFHVSTGQQLELLNWTKSDIKDKAQAIVFAVAEGLSDPLQEYIKVRKGKEVLDEAEKNLKPYIDGMQLNKGESYFGCQFTEKETGVKYDYSTCNDPEWNELNAKAIKLQAEIEERQTFLKAVKKPIETVNTESGETYTINPPVKSGKLSKAVSIK